MATVLYVYSRKASFIQTDREILAGRHEVLDWYQPGRLANPFSLARLVWRCDAVYGWWASLHTLMPLLLARLLRRPSLLVLGGYDVANMPEIGYGFQQGGVRRLVSRLAIRLAKRLCTYSEYNRREIERNVGVPAERVPPIYLGIPDRFGELPPEAERELLALCVGVVTADNLEVKGQRAFVEAAAELLSVRFALVGRLEDDPEVEELRDRAARNVELTDWVDDAELESWFRRASVYVQPSHHEGFGVAVAEAMLAGCIPVVTGAGALPEVVGEEGVRVASQHSVEVAAGIRRALALAADPQQGSQARARARERILSRFPVAARREALLRAIDELLALRGNGGDVDEGTGDEVERSASPPDPVEEP